MARAFEPVEADGEDGEGGRVGRRAVIDPGRATRRARELTARYLRSQLSPTAGYAADAATGETFDGERFDAGRDALRLAVPFIVEDFYEAWRDVGGSSLGEMWRAAADKRVPRGRSGLSGLPQALPAALGSGVKFYDEWPPTERERSQAPEPKPLDLGPVASRELQRLGLKVELVPKNWKVEGLTGDSRSFSGDSLAMPPESRAELEDLHAREVREAVERAVESPDYPSFETDAARREYMRRVVDAATDRAKNAFRLRVRERELQEIERLRETQDCLERRGRPPGLGALLERNAERLGQTPSLERRLRQSGAAGVGRPEALRSSSPDGPGGPPTPDPAGQAEEDAAVLADELREWGPPGIDDTQAAALRQSLDGMRPESFAEVVRVLGEDAHAPGVRQLGGAGLTASVLGAEALASLVPSRREGFKAHADRLRFVSMLASERARRPAQFVRDALAGRYGERLRAEFEEGNYNPRHSFGVMGHGDSPAWPPPMVGPILPRP